MLNNKFSDNTAKIIKFFKYFQKKLNLFIFIIKYIYIFANCNIMPLKGL